MPLVLALALAFAAPTDTVVIDGARWKALLNPEVKAEEPPGPTVRFREVRLEPTDEELRFEATWRIDAVKEGWFEARLTGPGVEVAHASWQGRDVAILETDEGVKLVIELDGPGVLAIRGVAVGDAHRQPVALDLLPAAAGRVRVKTDQEPKVTARGPVIELADGIWTGAPGLALELSDPTPPAARPDLATATAALGLTVGEGSYAAKGRVRWEIRHGELAEVQVDVGTAGSDLEVTGPTVASWTRSGSQVRVVLREPEDRLVELDLSWTGAVPDGDEATLALPQLKPLGAFKTESAVQLARDGEIEVVPQLAGWAAVPFSALPEWARGLVVGNATATLMASNSPAGSVRLFRFTPVNGPPTFVDTATITAAMTVDGNVLMRAHYAVRNDRSAVLRVTPPSGAQVVGARVAGETARVSKDGEAWLLPLEKSVETVEGLLSFPVEVTLLLRSEDWDRKEARSLPLPRVDAPVAVTRATLHLPPGYENRLDHGEGDVVDGFSDGEGIAYGQGTGSSAAAEVLMQEAVQAWMGNAFDEAEGILKQLEDIGGFDENARRLQSNLDVISGKGEGQYDVALERRVKEQAKARSLEDQVAQEETLKKAEEQYLRGEYAAAEQEYKKALDLGKKLDKLEQAESVEYSTSNSALESQLAVTEKKAKAKEEEKEERASKIAKNAPAMPPSIAAPAPARQTVSLLTTDAEDTGGEVLTKDFVQKLPTGRSYQSAIGVAAGVSGTGTGGGGLADGKANLGPMTGVSRNGGGDLRGPDSTVVYDFSDELIEGELAMPDGGYFGSANGDDYRTIDLGADGFIEGGEVGGIVGGVIGGIEGGVLGGVAAGVPGGAVAGVSVGTVFGGAVADPEPEEIVLEEEPMDLPVLIGDEDGYPDVDEMTVAKRQAGLRLPNVKVGGGRNKEGRYTEEDMLLSGEHAVAFNERMDDDRSRDNRQDADKRVPAVRAVQLTAVIPTQGQAVHYERLLLDADAVYALPIEATRRRDR